MGLKLMLGGVRCSFITLEEPKFFSGQKTKDTDKRRWSATALIPTASPYKKQIDDALRAVAREQWPLKFETILANILPDPKGCCWVDGARKEFEGYQGHWALSAHRTEDKGRPLVFDADKSPIYKPNNELYEGKAGRIYSGCFVNMQVEIWAQDNKAGKALRCALLGIQRFKDGDAFSGGTAPNADDFGEITEGAEADPLG